MTWIIGGSSYTKIPKLWRTAQLPIYLGLRLGELEGSYELVDIRETMTSQVVLYPL